MYILFILQIKKKQDTAAYQTYVLFVKTGIFRWSDCGEKLEFLTQNPIQLDKCGRLTLGDGWY